MHLKELKAIFPDKSFLQQITINSAACMIADGWFKVPSLNSHNYVNH
jgi:hypothetical protein